jgi:hypothetical protein
MKRIALMLLLVGAVLGLAAQAPARALAPTTDAETAATMAAMPDCMAKMEKPTSQKSCDCSRADCIAAMLGATPVFTLADFLTEMAEPAMVAIGPHAAATRTLIGRNPGPEPDPPTGLI